MLNFGISIIARHQYVFMWLILITVGPTPHLVAQEVSEEEIEVILDSMRDQLFEYNYYDSLNNEPSFFIFAQTAKNWAKKAEEAGYESAYYKAEHLRSLYYKYNGVSNKVYEILDSAAERALQAGDIETQVRFIYLKGTEYSRNDLYDLALEIFNKAYTMADSLNFARTKTNAVNAMAVNYARMRIDSMAIIYYKKAHELAVESNDLSEIVRTLGNIGITNGRMGKGDSALFYGQQAYDLALETKDKEGKRQALNVLIMAHQLRGDYQKSINLTTEMEELIGQSQDVGFLITPYLSRSKSYYGLGQLDRSLQDVNESLRLARYVNFTNGLLNALEWKTALLNEMKRYKLAYEASEELRSLKDDLHEAESQEKLAAMTQNYEIRERQNRINSLEQVNEANARGIFFRNLAIVALVLVSVVIVLLLVIAYRRRLEKEKYALQETQDQLLRSQLNPHFLFNALSSIQLFLINKGQGKEALEYLSKFAKLMRRILENSRESLVPLENEIATLRHYLDLQKIRFDDSFDYTISVETENDISEIMIPPMFAQPFIENSLEHGIADRDDGLIQIWFKETEEVLNFRVEDNGIGISRSTRTNHTSEHKPLATIITHDRVNILRRQLKKRIRFDIRDKKNDLEEITGTEVVFELPVIYR